MDEPFSSLCNCSSDAARPDKFQFAAVVRLFAFSRFVARRLRRCAVRNRWTSGIQAPVQKNRNSLRPGTDNLSGRDGCRRRPCPRTFLNLMRGLQGSDDAIASDSSSRQRRHPGNARRRSGDSFSQGFAKPPKRRNCIRDQHAERIRCRIVPRVQEIGNGQFPGGPFCLLSGSNGLGNGHTRKETNLEAGLDNACGSSGVRRDQHPVGHTSFTRRDGRKESEFRRSVLLLRRSRPVERGWRCAHAVSRRPLQQTTYCKACLAYVLWLVHRYCVLLYGPAAGFSGGVARVIRPCGAGVSAVAVAEFLAGPRSFHRCVRAGAGCKSSGSIAVRRPQQHCLSKPCSVGSDDASPTDTRRRNSSRRIFQRPPDPFA